MKGGGRGGSSRDPSVPGRVLEAFLDELANVGLANLSMDRVAQRAGVSKTTIYTRWSTKQDLVLAGFGHVARPFPTIDTGTLAGDMELLWRGFLGGAANRRYVTAMCELIAAAATDPSLHAELVGVQRTWREGVQAILDAARDRGELAAEADTALVAETIQALALSRALIGEQPAEELRPLLDQLIASPPPREK